MTPTSRAIKKYVWTPIPCYLLHVASLVRMGNWSLPSNFSRAKECYEVGWSDFLFFWFSKTGTLLLIGFIFMSSILKNWRILPSAHAKHSQQIFYFQKIIETLKMNIFLKICRNLHFTSKNNCKKLNSNLEFV